jgi:hypothetical protein
MKTFIIVAFISAVLFTALIIYNAQYKEVSSVTITRPKSNSSDQIKAIFTEKKRNSLIYPLIKSSILLISISSGKQYVEKEILYPGLSYSEIPNDGYSGIYDDALCYKDNNMNIILSLPIPKPNQSLKGSGQ